MENQRNINNEHVKGRFTPIIKKTLEVMAEKRLRIGSWQDSEKEPEDWSNAHKVCNAIQAFLTCHRILPEAFIRLPLDKKILLDDLKYLLDCVRKDGFEPGAYVPVGGYEAIDYAADIMTTFLDFIRYATDIRLKDELLKEVEQVIDKAISFLVDSVYEAPDGYRWAGSSIVASGKTVYSHVYFTCSAVNALYYAVEHYKKLDSARIERLTQLIQGSHTWLSKRKSGERYYSDEKLTITQSTSALYNMDALFSTWKLIKDSRIKDFAEQCLKDYYNFLKNSRSEFDLDIFYPALVRDAKAPVQIDDRTTIANCLKVFCLGKTVLDKGDLIDQAFLSFLSQLANDVIDEMDPDENVWEKGHYLIYSNLRTIEGLLLFEKYGAHEEIEKFSVFDYREIVRAALSSEAVMKAFIDEFRRLSGPRSEES